MHYRETLKNLLLAKLLNNTLAGANVFLMRTYAMSAAKVPAIAIYTSKEEAENSTIGNISKSLRDLTLTIEIYVKKQSDPDSEIDTIAQEIEQILGANNTLDDSLKFIEYKGIEIEQNGDGDNLFFVATMEYNLIYRVNSNDPTANI